MGSVITCIFYLFILFKGFEMLLQGFEGFEITRKIFLFVKNIHKKNSCLITSLTEPKIT